MLAGHLIILFLAEITIVTIYIVLRNQKILKIEVPFFERVIRIALKKTLIFFCSLPDEEMFSGINKITSRQKRFH